MTATAADYPWIFEWHHGLMSLGYCLTFVRGLTPDQVLDRLNVQDRVQIHGTSPIAEWANDTWNTYGGRELFVAVTQPEGWSVMFEWNGFVGVTQSVMAPVSAGTVTVGHFRNVNAVSGFLWLEDGDVLLSFEPLFPFRRFGANADDSVRLMAEVGFDLRDGEDRTFENPTAHAFALAERITGVRVTPTLLDNASYVGGRVSIPAPS